MSIRRAARKQSNFTIIDNVVFSSGLSFRAMGLLSYLLSKPDHWEVSVTQLVKHAKGTAKPDGRDAIYSILSELMDKGFVERVQVRNEQGQMGGTDYVVHDSPYSPEPLSSEPYTDEPHTGETTQVSTEVEVSTEPEESTDKTSVTSSVVTEVFEHWCQVMGKNGRTVLDSNRSRLIKKALERYSTEDVMAAISGCSMSAYHMGANDSGTKYNGLDLILRNAEKIEKFIEFSKTPPLNISSQPRTKHHGLTASTDGLTPNDDGTYRL